MPIDIDVNERLREIAAATLAIGEQEGVASITIRAVAARLGGSTTLVTNYLPTRSDLLANAVQHAYAAWTEEFDTEFGATSAEELLPTLARWSSTTSGNDAIWRRLMIELFTDSGLEPNVRKAVLARASEHHQELRSAAAHRGATDTLFVADVLFLLLRGFYLTSVEDPEAWTSERVIPIVERVVELLAPLH